MTTAGPPTKGPGPRSRSLILAGPIGFRGKGLPPSERKRIFDELFFEGARQRPYLKRFSVLMVLSALIAALGLVNDSAAVVIGAMLIAPLMTPMLGASAAIIEGWRGRFVGTFLIVVLGASVAIVVGFMVAQVIPHLQSGSPLTDEILARTRPNMVDLGIALAAGAAGAYIMIRSEASSALPGVGISVALVPPLATAGVLAGVGDPGLALGALLLFITNLLAIVFAAGVTFLLADFGAHRSSRVKKERWLAGAVLIVLLVAISVPLAFNAIATYGESDRNRLAADVLREWDPTLAVKRLVVDTTQRPLRVSMEISGEGLEQSPDTLASLLAQRLESPVELTLDFRPVYRGGSDAEGS